MSSNQESWSPLSWRDYPIVQQPEYADQEHLEKTLAALRQLPPLVGADEVDLLRAECARAASGEAFILQGGDCGERFEDCTHEVIASKLRVLQQMSVFLENRLGRPVVKIGRMAGQYAKPRSNDYEMVGGEAIAVYRGDIVNDQAPEQDKRRADPDRLQKAYFHAAATLNYMRWIAQEEEDGLPGQESDHFFPACLVSPDEDLAAELAQGRKEFQLPGFGPQYFTSHEGLVLAYEATQTRYVPGRKAWYNLGAHMLWIGDRTRDLNGAHIEYFRGIANPIGIKVGPSSKPQEICQIIRKLNPDNAHGKILLITRYGNHLVGQHLPALLKAVQNARLEVLWLCDPMHGNTSKTAEGYKTRSFCDIMDEIQVTLEAHEQAGTLMGGLHLELSGENVTECVGGLASLSAEHLSINYKSSCDPRLNYDQSLELALRVGRLLQSSACGRPKEERMPSGAFFWRSASRKSISFK